VLTSVFMIRLCGSGRGGAGEVEAE